jgi:hypothetical protein
MTSEEYLNDKLWPILVETVHTLVMYSHHKAYIRDTMMIENPDITAAQLAVRLNVSIGEALVILHELAEDKKFESQPG